MKIMLCVLCVLLALLMGCSNSDLEYENSRITKLETLVSDLVIELKNKKVIEVGHYTVNTGCGASSFYDEDDSCGTYSYHFKDNDYVSLEGLEDRLNMVYRYLGVHEVKEPARKYLSDSPLPSPITKWDYHMFENNIFENNILLPKYSD